MVLALARRQCSGAVDRKDNVVARVVENVRADTPEAFLNEVVSHKVSLLCTDQWAGYKHLGKEYPVIDDAHLQCSLSQKNCLALSSTFLAAGLGVAVIVVSLAARQPLRRLVTRQRALRQQGHAKLEEVDIFLRFDMLDPLR